MAKTGDVNRKAPSSAIVPLVKAPPIARVPSTVPNPVQTIPRPKKEKSDERDKDTKSFHQSLMTNLFKPEITQFFSQTFHAVTVSVVGGPQADLRRMWFLCLSAVFGRARKGLLSIHNRTLDAQIDVTGKSCSITYAYTFGGILETAFASFSSGRPLLPGAPGNLPWSQMKPQCGLDLFYTGPDQVTIGGNWPAFALASSSLGQLLNNPQVVNAIQNASSLRSAFPAFSARFPTLNIPPLSAFVAAAVPGLTAIDTGQIYAPDLVWIVDRADLVEGNNILRYPFAPWILYEQDANLGLGNAGSTGLLREIPVLTTPTGPGILLLNMNMRVSQPVQYNVSNLVEVTRDLTGIRFGSVAGFLSGVNPAFGTAPILPDDGRIITSGEKGDRRMQPPRPAFDGISRNHPLDMLANILYDPGYNLLPAPTAESDLTHAPLGASGLYVYDPGTIPSDLADTIIAGSLLQNSSEFEDVLPGFSIPFLAPLTPPNIIGANIGDPKPNQTRIPEGPPVIPNPQNGG